MCFGVSEFSVQEAKEQQELDKYHCPINAMLKCPNCHNVYDLNFSNQSCPKCQWNWMNDPGLIEEGGFYHHIIQHGKFNTCNRCGGKAEDGVGLNYADKKGWIVYCKKCRDECQIGKEYDNLLE